MSKIRVMLADDNSDILEHVSTLLNAHDPYEVIGALSNGADVLHEYDRLQPDVIVLDICMQLVSGIDVARQLRDFGCHCKIVFLTVHEDIDFVNIAMEAGGAAYVAKSRLGMDLIPAIDAALCEKPFVSPSLTYESV